MLPQDDDEDDRAELKAAQNCLCTGGLTIAMLNFTDSSDAFCNACGEAGLIPFLVEMSNEAKTCIPYLVKYVVRKSAFLLQRSC